MSGLDLDEDGECRRCGRAPMGDGECECTRQWVSITCAESDALRPGLSLHASCTDPDGHYGAPEVFTEWGNDDGPVLRDHKYPGPLIPGGQWYEREPNRKPCEHERAQRKSAEPSTANGPRVPCAHLPEAGPHPESLSSNPSTEIHPS